MRFARKWPRIRTSLWPRPRKILRRTPRAQRPSVPLPKRDKPQKCHPLFFYSGRVSPRREAQDLAVRVPADLKGLYAPLPIPLLPSPLHPCHNIGLILSMERRPTLHLERLRRVELVLHEDGRGDVGEAKAISSGLVADVAG